MTEGAATLNALSLKQGDAVFVGAEEDGGLVTGKGTLFRATMGLAIS